MYKHKNLFQRADRGQKVSYCGLRVEARQNSHACHFQGLLSEKSSYVGRSSGQGLCTANIRTPSLKFLLGYVA
jgi:hypothetical protein